MRSKLFVRETDAADIGRGLEVVDSLAGIVTAVSRDIRSLVPADGGDEAVAALVDEALESARAVMDGLSACAVSLELAADRVGGPVDRSMTSPDFFPELWALDGVERPRYDTPRYDTPDDSRTPGATAGRCRTALGWVKDRYSSVVVGLRWVGEDRDAFTGPRLTALRSALESAQDALALLEEGASTDRAGHSPVGAVDRTVSLAP